MQVVKRLGQVVTDSNDRPKDEVWSSDMSTHVTQFAALGRLLSLLLPAAHALLVGFGVSLAWDLQPARPTRLVLMPPRVCAG